MRRVGATLGLLALAASARGFWALWYGGTVTQFVLLELVALLLAAGGGWFWEQGEK